VVVIELFIVVWVMDFWVFLELVVVIGVVWDVLWVVGVFGFGVDWFFVFEIEVVVEVVCSGVVWC